MTVIRVVMHVHSDWSYDGYWSLESISRLYGALGVEAVLMTEHDTGFDPAKFPDYRAACAAASSRRCQLVPGIEYSNPDNSVHILTWGLSDFLTEGRPVIETLREVSARGGVAVFAHPARREAWRQFDRSWIPFLSAIEFWNRKCDGLVWGAEALRLIRETGLPGTVGQDFHRLRHLYPLSVRVDLRNSTRQDLESELAGAIGAGRFTPWALGNAVLGASGEPPGRLHPRLETTRQWIRDILRSSGLRR